MTQPNLTAEHITAEHITEVLNWRYATKKFNPDKKISEADWKALEQSLVLAPSSFGLQPWKFFVVRNLDLRQQLVEHAWNQSQVTDASHLVVLAIRKGIDNSNVNHYINLMSEVRETPRENLEGLEKAIKGFLQDPPFPFEVNSWSTRQVYLALGFFLYSAALLGIDACPMEGFVPAKYDEILGLSAQGYSSVVLCTAGYRAEDDKLADMKKVRYETDKVVQYID